MPLYFKQQLFFRQKTGFYFLYPGTKGTHLGSVVTHTFTTTQNTKLLHIAYMLRQLLTVSCSIIDQQCIMYYSIGFPSVKELALLEMCNQL